MLYCLQVINKCVCAAYSKLLPILKRFLDILYLICIIIGMAVFYEFVILSKAKYLFPLAYSFFTVFRIAV